MKIDRGVKRDKSTDMALVCFLAAKWFKAVLAAYLVLAMLLEELLWGALVSA